MLRTCSNSRRVVLATAALVAAGSVSAAAPLLYHHPFHEGPVHGGPDDLLLMPGSGLGAADRVVYAAVDEVGRAPLQPGLPAISSADVGFAEVVSHDHAPSSLVVRLPKALREGRSYALWAVNTRNEWSAPALINDPRPLWVSPAFAYATQSVAGLPRTLKIVGRNLAPAPGDAVQIRLSGPAQKILKAPPVDDALLADYAATAPLPDRLVPGSYRVALKRGSSGWVEIPQQRFEVRADPGSRPLFEIGDAAFGGCRPDDGVDDAPCIVRAIAAARRAGGGVVHLAPGTWELSARSLPATTGIVVPAGVDLMGDGPDRTVVRERADGEPAHDKATFTLLGRNRIEGIRFIDAHRYTPAMTGSTLLRLGALSPEATSGAPDAAVTDVVIDRNVFERPNVAVSAGNAHLERLIVTGNLFGAYRVALELGGDRYRVNERFYLEDSIIADNRFEPGSYIDLAARAGTMASEIGGSLRLDFSGNTADGTAAEYLDSPGDARGWRAAFFWHLNDDQEMLLVSRNSASCTGDKDGDGEAIAFDSNGNTFALPRAEPVLAADPGSVTVAGPLRMRQNDRDIRIPDYYRGHWVQVSSGTGLGQVRKIVSYEEHQGRVTFHVTPDFDVIPAVGGSRIGVGREFWQTLAVANRVDDRQPLCRKSNRTRPDAGVIGMWAQSADSVIAGNRQYDTDGIIFNQLYNEEQPTCAQCTAGTTYLDALEVRGNFIDGEYAWDDDCSASGIFGSVAAGPISTAPATASYGLSIGHNVIHRADGTRGGAISLIPTWFEGPEPHHWPVADDILIQHNEISGLDDAPAHPCAGSGPAHPRTAMSLASATLVSRAVLYGNSCPDARRALDSHGGRLTVLCPAGKSDDCGCGTP